VPDSGAHQDQKRTLAGASCRKCWTKDGMIPVMTSDMAGARTYDDGPTRRREQRAWYWYEFAQSAFVTTVSVVLATPYLTAVAETAACGAAGTDVNPCTQDLHVLGIPVAPGSAVFYVVTIATVLSFLAMPVVGALADRSPSKRRWLLIYAAIGAVATMCLFFVTGTNWLLGAFLLIIGNVALIASLTVYAAILVDIAEPDERDRVSTEGWAFGYVGGFLLLIVSLVLVQMHDTFGLSEGLAVRVGFLLAGVWWLVFSIVPYLGIKDRIVEAREAKVSFRTSFSQLRDTLSHVRKYPQTLRFLIAFLFFNDGVQTVIVVAAVYGTQELGMSITNVILAVLIVEITGIIGALFMGRTAAKRGAQQVILGALVVWVVIVFIGYFLPAHSPSMFWLMAGLIGLVVAGTQALSRSLFSQLIPRGREGEYFSLYQAAERGTSWLGTLLFGLTYQFTGSYRSALFALIVFFIIGGYLLRKVDIARGIREAGNELPAVL